MGGKRGARGEKRRRKQGGDEREGQRAKMRQAERVGSRGHPGTAGGHPGRAVERVVELGGFALVPVPVSSPDVFPKTLTLRTYTLLHD